MGFSRRSPSGYLFRMGLASLVIHGGLIVLSQMTPWMKTIRVQPATYAVTLVPLSLSEPEPFRAPEKHEPKEAAPKPVEKTQPVTAPKKDDIVEKIRKPTPKIEKPKEDTESLKRLHEAMEEIRKKAALDEIKRKVAQREKPEERPRSPAPTVSSTTSSRIISSPTSQSKQSESRLNEYYSLVWAKIKEEWTLPENLLKERVDLEAIVVIIIEKSGNVKESWLEKSSGDSLYDQMALRAIKKADPLPPFPKELTDSTLEIGFRFFQD